MGSIHGVNRHAAILSPERLDDYLVEANPVRFLDAFVDPLNLTTRGVQRAKPAATGRPAYHPADLLKLYIYGSRSRLRSRRRLAQATHRTVAWMWLLKKLRPDPKATADFRKNDLAPLRRVGRAFTLWRTQPDLFAGGPAAIAGGEFNAVEAKERHLTQGRLKQLLQRSDQRGEG